MHRVTSPGVQAQRFRPRGSGPGFMVPGSPPALVERVFFSILKRHSTQSLLLALQDYVDVGVMLEFNT